MDSTLVGLLLLLPSVVCAVVPMVLFLAFVWWMDRYDREPLWLVLLTFLWGGVGGVLFGIIGSVTLMTPLLILGASATFSDAAGTVFIAPLAEEPAKALVLLFLMWNRAFDNTTDGFVYGAAAGLGFGMTENFMYFLTIAFTGDPQAWAQTVVVRTMYSAVMHASASSIVGAALGAARFRGMLTVAGAGPVGLLLAIGVHALWNGLITLDTLKGANGKLQTANLVVFPFEVALLFMIFQLCLLHEASTIRHELSEEVERGLIPKHHPAILSSWSRRRSTGWLPRHVDRDRYIAAATALALRKRQARLAGPGAEFYRDEVDRLRRRVGILLEPTTDQRR